MKYHLLTYFSGIFTGITISCAFITHPFSIVIGSASWVVSIIFLGWSFSEQDRGK